MRQNENLLPSVIVAGCCFKVIVIGAGMRIKYAVKEKIARKG